VPIYLEWLDCLDSCTEIEPEKEDLTFGPARRSNNSVRKTRRIDVAFTTKDLKGLQYQICSLPPPAPDSIAHDSDIVKGVATTIPSCSCTVLSGTLGIVGSGFAAGGCVDVSCRMSIGVIFAMLWGQHWWKSGLRDHCMIRGTTFRAHVHDSCGNENYACGILRDRDCYCTVDHSPLFTFCRARIMVTTTYIN